MVQPEEIHVAVVVQTELVAMVAGVVGCLKGEIHLQILPQYCELNAASVV